MTDTKALLISRKLAQQLFQLVQADESQLVGGWLVQHADGSLHPLPSANAAAHPSQHYAPDAKACANLPAEQRVFGRFQRLPSGQQQPADDHFEGWLLTLSLDIKGVLQLHAWRHDPGLREVPLRILAEN